MKQIIKRGFVVVQPHNRLLLTSDFLGRQLDVYMDAEFAAMAAKAAGGEVMAVEVVAEIPVSVH